MLAAALSLAGAAQAETAPPPAHPLAAALESAGAGNVRAARLLAAKRKDPLVQKLVAWRLMTRPAAEGYFAEAARFLKTNPDWPRLGAVRATAERELPEAWTGQRLLTWFDEHPPVSLEGKLRRARTLYEEGRYEAAAAAARDIWVDEALPFLQQGPFLRRFGKLLRPEDEQARFQRLLRARAWTPATRQATRLGGPNPALVRVLIQVSGGRIGLEAARKRLPPALHDHPVLLYEAARRLRRDRRQWAVFAILERLPDGLPEDERWWPLRHWTARQLLKEAAPQQAYGVVAGHGQTRGASFSEAEWLAGWIALRFLERPEPALAHFRRMFESVATPVSRARAAYWSGRAVESLGLQTEAKGFFTAAAKHGTTFYGQLAAKQLGRDPVVGGPGPRPSPVLAAEFEQREPVLATRLLATTGSLEVARVFLTHLEKQAKTTEEKLLVADLARTTGRPDLALRIARRFRSEGAIFVDWLYPRRDGGFKVKHRLDPHLVDAVIRQESGFYSRAVSSAGARGLMQLMPGTARVTARREGLAYSRHKLTTRPDYNMKLGTAYLSGLLERFGGALPLALAGYNAGPANVERWLDDYGDPASGQIDIIDWIESIPFSETRNYVQRIIESVEVYRQLDGSTQRSDLLSPGRKSVN